MELDTTVDPDRAAQLVDELRGVACAAEPALEDRELRVLDEAAAFLEDVACIERGERLMQSEITGQTYRVTRWIDLEDDKIIALSKEEVEES